MRIESGMEMQTMMVLRQLPRKSRIISPVSSAAMSGFFAARRVMAARTKMD